MNKRMMKTQFGTIVVMAVVLLLSVIISMLQYRSNEKGADYGRRAAYAVSRQKAEINKGVWKKGTYPYILVDLEGTVLYADREFQKKAGQKVPLEEILSGTSSLLGEKTWQNSYVYRTVIMQERARQVLIFLIPYKALEGEAEVVSYGRIFLPLLIGIIIVILIKGVEIYYVRIRIQKPVVETADSAKAIIKGNYDLEVVRTHNKKLREDEIGELIFSFELMRDELKNKQLREEQLNRNQKELISCISHDLKTPISTIKAYAEGIRDGIAKTEESRQEYLAIMINKTNLLIDMIEELLEYSNAQLQKLHIEKQETYFKNYYQGVMEELERYAVQRDTLFDWMPIEEDLLVNIDKNRITEVLYNLVENSMKYRSERQLMIEVCAKRKDNWLEIHVQDNGMGIQAQDIPFLFDKFYRGEKSRTSSVPGSGLGLSICKYIVEEHGGGIGCMEKEVGCEFVMTLPLL